MKGTYYDISCENTCGPGRASLKPGQGLGLKIVENIVARCDYLMETERAEGTYKVTVAIPTD